MKWIESHPHLNFNQNLWQKTEKMIGLLAEIKVYVEILCQTPILPELRTKLHLVSMIKGVQATTAIEGNSLTFEEIEQIANKTANLPPSKSYQEREVLNVYNAFQSLVYQLIVHKEPRLIRPEMLQDFHANIGRGLGEVFQAIPGRWRENQVVVGGYRPPDYIHVPELMTAFCDWLHRTFHYGTNNHCLTDVLIEAPVAHAVFEWIHPFGDGNGRTGRLLEFYILLRAGLPTIACHLLSNHYNNTRTEYYTYLSESHRKRDLTQFIEYALVGLRDGLRISLNEIIEDQRRIVWKNHVYKTFENYSLTTKVKERQLALALTMPIDAALPLDALPFIDSHLAYKYGGVTMKTLERDVENLLALELLVQDRDLYRLNVENLLLEYSTLRFDDGVIL